MNEGSDGADVTDVFLQPTTTVFRINLCKTFYNASFDQLIQRKRWQHCCQAAELELTRTKNCFSQKGHARQRRSQICCSDQLRRLLSSDTH